MEDFVRDQKNVGRKTITTLLDLSVADMKEEEELELTWGYCPIFYVEENYTDRTLSGVCLFVRFPPNALRTGFILERMHAKEISNMNLNRIFNNIFTVSFVGEMRSIQSFHGIRYISIL